MATTRTYGDGCAVARGLDLVGERWALLVIRELLLGAKRFTDLKRGLPNASPNTISERLRELERHGIVRRTKLPPPTSAYVYELTHWGRELEQTVLSLGRWAVRSPSQPGDDPVGDDPVGVDSVVLAFKTLFDSAAAGAMRATYGLRIGDDRFRIEVSGGQIEVARGDADRPDATIETDLAVLREVVWGGDSLADALRAGTMRVEGDRLALERLFRLFPMPEPATA